MWLFTVIHITCWSKRAEEWTLNPSKRTKWITEFLHRHICNWYSTSFVSGRKTSSISHAQNVAKTLRIYKYRLIHSLSLVFCCYRHLNHITKDTMQQYCIKWKNHMKNFQSNLPKVSCVDKFSDDCKCNDSWDSCLAHLFIIFSVFSKPKISRLHPAGGRKASPAGT